MSDFRNDPMQKRSNDRIDALAEATRAAIELHGIRDFTTSHIAELSGSSVGVVYRYFPDKWAWLEHVYPTVVSTEEQIAALEEGTVLHCRVGEVFWLAPGQMERLWFAAGYPEGMAWTDAQVQDWGPLKVLHRPGVEWVVEQPAAAAEGAA